MPKIFDDSLLNRSIPCSKIKFKNMARPQENSLKIRIEHLKQKLTDPIKDEDEIWTENA